MLVEDEDELFLMHFGVKGMRWGKRGTKKTPTKSDIVKADRKNASKNRRLLSDADLKSRIERIQSEKRLKELTDADLAPGRTAAMNTLKYVGDKTIKTVAAGAALYAVKAALTKEFSLKDAAAYIAPKPKTK